MVARTADGGGEWTVTRVPEGPDLVTVGFAASDTTGLVLDRSGRVFFTDDGRTWKPSPYRMQATSFAGADLGYFIGRNGAFLPAHDIEILGSSRAEEPGRFRQLSFLDSLQGWATDSIGVLWVTSDGGRRWDSVLGQSVPLPGKLAFADQETGWAISGRGQLLRTDDGGQGWTHELGRVKLHAVGFASDDEGFAVGEQGALLATDDGGDSWEPQRLATDRDLMAVRFSSRVSGLIADARGGAWRTSDGGHEWIPDTLADSLTPGRAAAVTITGSGEIVAVAARRVFRRRIGEPAWRETSTGGSEFRSLTEAGRRLAVADAEGRIWHTRDLGQGWTPDTSSSPSAYMIFAADSEHVWVVGRDGVVWRFMGAGAPWAVDRDATRDRLRSAAAYEGGRAAGVTAAGAVVVSEDSGRTWADPAHPTRSPAPWYWLAIAVVLGLILVGKPTVPRRRPSVADVLVSDRPIRKGDPDPLGLTSVALGLSRFIRNSRTEPPLTVAITGKWGTGKSSLMNLLQDDLREYGFRPIWFNAWHHQKEEHLLASLLHRVQEEAPPPLFHPGGLMFRLRLLWIRADRYRKLAAFSAVVMVAGLGYLASDFEAQANRMLAGAAHGIHVVKQIWPGEEPSISRPVATADTAHATNHYVAEGGSFLALLALVSALATLWKGLHTFGGIPASLMTTMRGAFRLRDLQAQTGFRSQFETEFQEATQALGERALVILVDDLDRCNPKNVLEVLEAINFLVSSGRCFVLIGMDRDFVEGCVGLGFQDVAKELAVGGRRVPDDSKNPDERERNIRRDFAVQYLEKLVNIEVPVPPATALQLSDLVAGAGTEDELADRRRRRLRGLELSARTAAAVLAVVGFGWLFTFTKEYGERELIAAALAGAAPTEEASAAAGSGGSTAGQGSVPGDGGPTFAVAGLAGDLVPSDSAPSSWTLLVICALLVVGGGILALLRRPVVSVHDSDEFTDALNVWSPLIYGRRNTPRGIKKFLNRVRFYAMRQEAHLPVERQWDRVVGWIRRRRSIDRLLRWILGEPAEASANPVEKPDASEVRIPETVLVALSSVQECQAELLDRPELYTDFSDFLVKSVKPLPESVKSNLASAAAWGPLEKYQARFARLSAGLRIA